MDFKAYRAYLVICTVYVIYSSGYHSRPCDSVRKVVSSLPSQMIWAYVFPPWSDLLHKVSCVWMSTPCHLGQCSALSRAVSEPILQMGKYISSDMNSNYHFHHYWQIPHVFVVVFIRCSCYNNTLLDRMISNGRYCAQILRLIKTASMFP